MSNYLEIVRLNELSFSQRKISDMVGSGRPVVKRTIDTATQHKLTYKELSGWDADRMDTLFDSKQSKPTQRGPAGLRIVIQVARSAGCDDAVIMVRVCRYVPA